MLIGLGRTATLFAEATARQRNVDGTSTACDAVERNLALIWRVGTGITCWNPVDLGGAATRANQWFVVAVCRDQCQCFRRPVLLDSSTTHGCHLP